MAPAKPKKGAGGDQTAKKFGGLLAVWHTATTKECCLSLLAPLLYAAELSDARACAGFQGMPPAITGGHMY